MLKNNEISHTLIKNCKSQNQAKYIIIIYYHIKKQVKKEKKFVK